MPRPLPLILLLALLTSTASAQDTLPPDQRTAIDKAAVEILRSTGAPSVSIAVVTDGRVAYTRALGFAQIDPPRPATPEMRYAIGSISKQFTAAAILLLAEEGKLSLDDKVARWLPTLTRANEVSVRQLLSMTAGYQDYWPQDYVFEQMLHPIAGQGVLDQWARKPLDFEPGTRWQYSNTNYIAAGLIVEKISGMSLVDFLHQRVFDPLHMTTVFDTDRAALPPQDAARYVRYALGPLRPAVKEGPGWLFAAGELAMTAHDLALWDVSLIDQTVLKPASYRALETEVRLNDGAPSRYALGLQIATSPEGRRSLTHGGEISGFSARNTVYPDDRAAVAVLCNFDTTDAAERIATKTASIILPAPKRPAAAQPVDDAALRKTKQVFAALQHGQIDRALFTPNANAFFTDEVLKDYASSLSPLGDPESFTPTRQQLRGGMTYRGFTIRFKAKTLRAWTYSTPDEKIEQFMVAEE